MADELARLLGADCTLAAYDDLDRGRPELGTGVLERVMRELNRRSDVGVRWTIPSVRMSLAA